MNQKGFTLMGQIVAIGLAVLGMGIVAPMLLSHFADGKTAALGETLNNTQTAFNSYYVKNEGLISDAEAGTVTDIDTEVLTAATSEVGYFDEMVDGSFMSRIPNDGAIVYHIIKDKDETAYYVIGSYDAANKTAVEARIKDLNSKIDKMDTAGSEDAEGILQWDAANNEFYFLLYGEQVDVSTATWHR